MSSTTQCARLATAAIAALLLLGATAHAATPEQKCKSTIIKESGKFVAAKTKALQKCEEAIVKGKSGFTSTPGTRCTDVQGKTNAAIAKAETKFRSKVDGACGGADKSCTATGDNLTLTSIDWNIGQCPDFESRDCSNTIEHCGDIADCLICMNEVAVDQAIDLYYDELATGEFGTSSPDNKCQAAIGKETTKFMLAKSKILAKCQDAVNQGKSGFTAPCPGGDSSGKTALAIANAEAKKIAKLCKTCGGPDKVCGGGDDPDPQTDIGFADNCPALVVPGGEDCGAIGAITTIQDMIDCVDCVTEFKVDCLDAATVPGQSNYSPNCNACISAAPTGACPTGLVFSSAGGFTSDLDSGWTGISHDAEIPSNGTLTLNVTGCDNASHPCGECAASGPVVNAGGPEVANQRCTQAPWIQCTSAAQCPGATPCVFFFGAPLPLSAGAVSVCVTNEINGSVTGTINVEDGTAATLINLFTKVYVTGTVDRPCPQCVNGTCDVGDRAGESCTPMGVSPQFGVISLDCPPPAGSLSGTLPVRLPTATGVQSVSLSAASPNCTASGATSDKCFCDTCNNSNAEPCFTDADCPDNPPATPGVCGGPRCQGGIDAGEPCDPQTPATCSTLSCGTVGELSRPNTCSNGVCVANPSDTDSTNEARCQLGPNDNVCSIQTYRGCSSAADCDPVLNPSCPDCLPGQTCAVQRRECFVDNGQIGGTVSVGGAASPPCGNVSKPRLGALFCIGDTGYPAVNSSAGLPGLGRVTLFGTARLQ